MKFHENPSSGGRVVPCWQTDGLTDKHDGANSRFMQFCERLKHENNTNIEVYRTRCELRTRISYLRRGCRWGILCIPKQTFRLRRISISWVITALRNTVFHDIRHHTLHFRQQQQHNLHPIPVNSSSLLVLETGNTNILLVGFGGLEVACWPLVPKFAGSNPTEAVELFRAKKILSTPSFGWEVKPSVPWSRFTACKRSQNVTWKSGIFRQNYSAISRPCSSTFGC